MSPVLGERTAPDVVSGAVAFRTLATTGAPPLRERDFWRAVVATLLVTLRPWVSLTIAQDPAADKVLSQEPFGLLVGMLDQHSR